MKWIQTYSGQLINLDHMAVIDKTDEAVTIASGGAMFVVAELADMTNGETLDEVMARLSRFIQGKRQGYKDAVYSFPERDVARAALRAAGLPKRPNGAGQLSESKLPKLSLRLVMEDAETPYHLYADEELVQKFAAFED